MCCSNLGKRGVMHQAATVTAERRIRHHRQTTLLAPWQQITFNTAAVKAVRDLIGRATMPIRNTEEIFHVADLKVGHAPGTNFPRGA